jgi:hypothetical protein
MNYGLPDPNAINKVFEGYDDKDTIVFFDTNTFPIPPLKHEEFRQYSNDYLSDFFHYYDFLRAKHSLDENENCGECIKLLDDIIDYALSFRKNILLSLEKITTIKNVQNEIKCLYKQFEEDGKKLCEIFSGSQELVKKKIEALKIEDDYKKWVIDSVKSLHKDGRVLYPPAAEVFDFYHEPLFKFLLRSITKSNGNIGSFVDKKLAATSLYLSTLSETPRKIRLVGHDHHLIEILKNFLGSHEEISQKFSDLMEILYNNDSKPMDLRSFLKYFDRLPDSDITVFRWETFEEAFSTKIHPIKREIPEKDLFTETVQVPV